MTIKFFKHTTHIEFAIVVLLLFENNFSVPDSPRISFIKSTNWNIDMLAYKSPYCMFDIFSIHIIHSFIVKILFFVRNITRTLGPGNSKRSSVEEEDQTLLF